MLKKHVFIIFIYTFLHKPKISKLYLLYFISEASSAKFDKYLDSFELLISETCSQLSHIENAVALEI